MDPTNTSSMPPSTPVPTPKKRRGCFFYGCLTTVIAVLLSLVAMYYVASKSIRFVVENYGSAEPLNLPRETVSVGDHQDVIIRVRDFRQKVQAGTAREPLALTQKDLNAVLQHDQRFEGIPSAAAIADGAIIVSGSLPLEGFGYKGRFLNAEIRIVPVEGTTPPQLKVKSVTLGDKTITPELAQQVEQKNLAESFNEDAELKDIWSKLSKVEVKDGTLLLYPQ